MKKQINLIIVSLCFIIGLAGLIGCEVKFDYEKNITVVVREDGSGTKAAFMELIGLKGQIDPKGVVVATSASSILAEIKSNKHAIAYESLGYITSNVKILNINGAKASVENIKNGTYALSRPLNIVYKPLALDNALCKAFFDFLQSNDARYIIDAAGYVSIFEGTVDYTVLASLKGTIKVSGSTSVQPLMVILAERFETLQAGVTIEISGGGTGTGYTNAENGTSDFGMISESFNIEKAKSCTNYEVAKDGIAVIINNLNPLDNIDMDQLKNIYNPKQANESKIKVWDDLF